MYAGSSLPPGEVRQTETTGTMPKIAGPDHFRPAFLRSETGFFTYETYVILSLLDVRHALDYCLNVKFILQTEIFMKNRIEDLRKRNGLTQQKLAESLGVSRQTIISLERGRYNPSIMLAYKMAKVFNCAIEDVFILEEE